ncbi:MAG: Lin0512 family protein [Actinomycetota bacterium]
MTLVRWITEMGMGVDVHGGDYTKAARRAVSDALRHSSLNFFEATDYTVHDMHVEVRLGVAAPEAVDTDAVAAEVPYGTVTVTAERGGLDVAAPNGRDRMVIANAAILVSFDDGAS